MIPSSRKDESSGSAEKEPQGTKTTQIHSSLGRNFLPGFRTGHSPPGRGLVWCCPVYNSLRQNTWKNGCWVLLQNFWFSSSKVAPGHLPFSKFLGDWSGHCLWKTIVTVHPDQPRGRKSRRETESWEEKTSLWLNFVKGISVPVLALQS